MSLEVVLVGNRNYTPPLRGGATRCHPSGYCPIRVLCGFRVGDFEADLIVGVGRRGYLLTVVERRTGRLFAAPLKHKTARSVSRALVRLLRLYRDAVKTITYDNRREFAWRRRVARALDCRSCFARPYHSWEKGTVENANGLVRQYFSKHKPMNKVTKRELDAVADEINRRPRKRLGWDTPAQAFVAEIERTGQADMWYKPQGGVELGIAMQGTP